MMSEGETTLRFAIPRFLPMKNLSLEVFLGVLFSGNL